MDYAVRLTPSEGAKCTEVIQYIVDNCQTAVIVEHSPENGFGKVKHYHIHVEGLRINANSLQRSITRYGFLAGNTGRSVKTKYGKDNPKPVDRGNITYISKGQLEPVQLHNITHDEYISLRSQWVDYKSHPTAPESGKAKKSSKTVSRYDMLDEMLEILREPYECKCVECKYERSVAVQYGREYKINWDYSHSHQHPERAGQVILQVRKKYNRGYNDHALDGDMCMLYNEGRPYDMSNNWRDRWRKINCAQHS